MEIPEMSMGMLGWAAIAGLVASLTNLDDIINSIKLPGRILAVGRFLTNFGTMLKDTFKLKNLEKLLPKFTLPKMEETTKLLSKWFNGGIEKIKNLFKFDSPGFLKFIDDVNLKSTSLLTDLTKGAGDVGKTIKSMLGLDSPGFVKFVSDVKLSGTSMLDDLTIGVGKVKSGFKSIITPITTFFESAKTIGTTVLDAGGKGITDGITSIKSMFTSVKTFFESVKTLGTTVLEGAGKGITDGITSIKNMFTSVKTFFAGIFSPITDLVSAIASDLGKGEGGGFISRGITAIGDFFKPLKTFFGTVWDVIQVPLKAAAGLVGRISLVIGIVMGLFDFFTGFVDGFSEKESTFDEDGNEIKDQRSMLQKTMDGVKQGIFNMFREMLAIPADLIKDGLSWIMAKLGFPGAEKSMDSFSFTKKFDELFSGEFSFVEIFTKLLTGLGEWFDGMMESAKEIIRNIPGMGDFGKSDADIASDRQAEIKEDIKALEEKRKTALFEKDQFKLGLGKYSDLATSKEDIDAEIAELNKESVDLQAKTASNIGTLTKKATEGNSIYVQDIGAQELMSKTNDSLEKTAEVKIGSSANDNNIIVAPANMGGGGGGAAPDMRGGGNTTNVVNNSSNSRNIQLKMADNNRPEQQHARRFAAGGPM